MESFNGKLGDELLTGEVFDTLTAARVVTERWRRFYNQIREYRMSSGGDLKKSITQRHKGRDGNEDSDEVLSSVSLF
ncbi:MAG: transposase [Bacteroidetes bacterium]|nr:MAG: transposase [Bacteroidota bacterium]